MSSNCMIGWIITIQWEDTYDPLYKSNKAAQLDSERLLIELKNKPCEGLMSKAPCIHKGLYHES